MPFGKLSLGGLGSLGGNPLRWIAPYKAAGQNPAAILNFRSNKYAVTTVPLGSIAGATAAQLSVLRPATLSEMITAFTRATVKSFFDPSGTIQSAAINTPAIDFSTGFQRLSLNGAGTNVIPNNSRQGAVAGVIGSGGALPTGWSTSGLAGLTVTVALATENGIPCVDIRFNGVSGSTTGALIFDFPFAATTTGDIWTLSQYLKLSAGSFANVSSIMPSEDEYTPGPTYLRTQNGGAVTVTGTLARTTTQFTMGATTTLIGAGYLFFTYLNASAIDFTLRIGYPQLEKSAFVTPPIITTAGAVTRAADRFRLSPTLEAILQRAAAGGLVMGFNNQRTTGRLLGEATTDAMILNQAATTARGNKTANLDATFGSGNFSGSFGAIMAFDGAGRSLVADGGTVVSDVNGPGDRTTVYLGDDAGGATPGDGWYDLLAVYPFRPTDPTLQGLARAYP